MRKNSETIRLLLTGGGTGGHLFPAIATAQEFQNQMVGTEVLFVGTRRKMDTKSLSLYGFPSRAITCYGLKGKNFLQLIKALASLPVAYVQALRIIREFKPDVLLGVGGYVTGPVVAAGKSMGIPTVIHEQNSIPGLANRKLGSIVDRICLSLPGSGTAFKPEKVFFTGNPVRKKILELGEKTIASASDRRHLLVLGGSQGAHAINDLVPRALQGISRGELANFHVTHQTGSMDVDKVRSAYRTAGIEARVEPFFTDMHKIYEKAELLVSRAGATTLSEIAVLGKPAILIPYPHAADNHQEENGRYYVRGGGALQFTQKDLSPEILREAIVRLIYDKAELERMASSMKNLSFPDAHKRIVACCMEEIEKHRK